MLLVTSTSDFGGEGFTDDLLGDLVTDFRRFPGLFLCSFFNDGFPGLLKGLLKDLDVFLCALPPPLLESEEAKYMSKLDCDRCRFLEDVPEDGGGVLKSVSSLSCSGRDGNTLDSPTENLLRNSSYK